MCRARSAASRCASASPDRPGPGHLSCHRQGSYFATPGSRKLAAAGPVGLRPAAFRGDSFEDPSPTDSESPAAGSRNRQRLLIPARAGRKGRAVLFVGEWDSDKLPPIKKMVGDRLQRQLLPIYERR